MTVGNENDAMLARYEGEPIGAGYTRIVYLYNDVIYKVETDPGWNRQEYNNINSIILPAPFAFPEATLYGEVIAMEYIDGQATGECYCYTTCQCESTLTDEQCALVTALGLDDARSYGNTIVKNDVYYIVDATY